MRAGLRRRRDRAAWAEHRGGRQRRGPGARQPGVLANEMYVSGGSRGSEAALLLGAYYPGLVHGVIASSPGEVTLCSYPGCTGPAWTLHGKPLPYTNGPDNPAPAAVIPVQKINGPLLLDCGTADQIWNS